MTYRALLIGNSTFEADAGLNPLNAPTKDVARLHRALVDSATGLFADEHVRLVIERTSDDLLDELDVFFTSAHRDDLLLLYYSGHGLLDERNQLFLCGRNTRSDRLLRTAVSNVRINEFIEQSVARCTVIILDCCSSGMFKGGADLGIPLAGPGRYVVSSTRGSALANDAAIATGTSLFTEHLVTGLLGEAEDRDGDGFLDLREIYDYVRTKLTATTKQIPHSRFDGDASVVLARRGGAPRPKGRPGPAHAGDPTFVLSENVITLQDVDPNERLSPEVVEIYHLGDQDVDCTAETDSLWLRAEVQGDRVVVVLNPAPGHNRGKIVIRDRTSGTAQVLRVHVYVRAAEYAPAPGSPASDSPATMVGDAFLKPVPPRVSARASVPPPAPPAQTARIPAPPSSRPPGGHRRRWVVVSALALVLVLAVSGLAYGFTRAPGDRVVPSVVGMAQADAATALRGNGLTPVVVPPTVAAPCVPGQVLAQNPPPRQRVHDRASITMTVCGAGSPVDASGPPLTPSAGASTPQPAVTTTKAITPKVAVPSLGSTRDSAQIALRAAGLYAHFVPRDSTAPADQVIGSKPGPGTTVSRGSTIIVYLSRANLVEVKDVVGFTSGHAADVLQSDGFNVSVRNAPADSPAGTVFDQTPNAGAKAVRGSTVTISVSQGPGTDSPSGNGGGNGG